MTQSKSKESMMLHFADNNTNGYTTEQLARANAEMDSRLKAMGLPYGDDFHGDGNLLMDDGQAAFDWYKRECERVLRWVEIDHTTYQVAYQLGGRGASSLSMAESAESLHAARAAALDSGDCQAIRLVAIDYPADGSDPWGIERELTQQELAKLEDLCEAVLRTRA